MVDRTGARVVGALALLLGSGVLLAPASGCEAVGNLGGGADAGSFAIAFQWDEPPAETVWIWARVEHRPEGAAVPGDTLVVDGPAEFAPGGSVTLDLGNVPNGDDRVVVVEVREGPQSSLRVVYFGVSEPFGIEPGKDTSVDVPLSFQAPEADDQSGAVRLAFGEALEAREVVLAAEVEDVTVIIDSVNARGAILANDASFSAGLKQYSFEGEEGAELCDIAADEAAEDTEITCIVPAWDLTVEGDPPAHNDQLGVFVKLVDRFGYESNVLDAKVTVDDQGPVVSFAALPDDLISPGQVAVLTLTADEAIDLVDSTLVLSLVEGEVPLAFEGPERVTESGFTYQWTAPASEEADGSAMRFTVALFDELGNQAEPFQLVQKLDDGSSPPLELRVDATPPDLLPGSVTDLPVQHWGEPDLATPLAFDFVMVEANPLLPEGATCDSTCPLVRLDGRTLGVVSREPALDDLKEDRWGFSYTYTIDPADWEGAQDKEVPITIRWTDEADNVSTQLHPFAGAEPRLDLTAPFSTSCTISPSGRPVGVGETLVVVLNASEALTEEYPQFDPGEGLELTITDQAGLTTTASAGPFPVDIEASYGFTVELRDLYGNQNDEACPQTFLVDTVYPTVDGDVEVSDTNLSHGESAILTFTVTEPLPKGASVLVGSEEIPVDPVGEGGLTWAATFTANEEIHTTGVRPVTLDLEDVALNKTLDTDSVAPLVLDFDAPQAECSFSHPAGEDGEGKPAKLGDIVQISVSVNEPTAVGSPSLTPEGLELTASTTGLTTTWTRTIVPDDGVGSFSWSLDVEDLSGNALAGVCSGEGSFDAQPPTLVAGPSLPEGDDGKYKAGDTVVLALEVSEPLAGPPEVLIGALAAVVTASEEPDSETLWTATLEVPDDPGGTILSVTVSLEDLAGNTATAGHDLDPLAFDVGAPGVTCSASHPGGKLAKLDDTIQIVVNVTEALASGYPDFTSDGLDFTEAAAGFSTTYTRTLGSEDGDGSYTWSVDVVDAAGNPADADVLALCSGGGAFDTTPPALVGEPQLIGDDDGSYKPEDTITITLVASEPLGPPPSVTIGTLPMEVTPDEDAGDDAWLATLIVPSEADSGLLLVTIGLEDKAGNTTSPKHGLAPLLFDVEAPEVDCSIAPDVDHPLGHGETITLVLNANEKLAADSPTLEVLEGSFEPIAKKSGFSSTYTLDLDEEGVEQAIAWTFALEDLAGNLIEEVCAGSFDIDTVYPTLVLDSALTIDLDGEPKGSTILRASETIELSLTVSEALEDPPLVVLGDLPPQPAEPVGTDSLIYTSTLVVPAAGETGSTPGIKALSIELTDSALNQRSYDTGESYTFDLEAPQLTCTISPDQGGLVGHGGAITVFASASEPLAGQGKPELEVLAGPLKFPEPTSSGLTHTFKVELDELDVVGTQSWQLHAEDPAGNSSTACAWQVSLDSQYPSILEPALLNDDGTPADGVYRPGDVIILELRTSEVLEELPEVLLGEIDFPVTLVEGETTTYRGELTVPSDATSGIKKIAITLVDPAGNQFFDDKVLDPITFDVTPPEVTCTVSPAAGNAVNVGGTIVITVNSTEELDEAYPILTQDPADAVDFVKSTVGFSTNYTASVDEGLGIGSFSFTLDVKDLAGNEVLDACEGTVLIDSELPVLSGGTVSHTYAKVGDTISVTFAVSEGLLEAPFVTAGGEKMTATAGTIDAASTWTFEYPITTADSQGLKPVRATIADKANNVVIDDDFVEAVTFDFEVLDASCLVTPLSGSVKEDGELKISVTPVEDMAEGWPKITPTGLSLIEETTGVTTSWTQDFGGQQVVGPWSATVELKDLAGNKATAPCAPAGGQVDTVPPSIETHAVTEASGFAANDLVEIELITSETLSVTPEVLIGDVAATSLTGDGTSFTYELLAASGPGEGTWDLDVILVDDVGNEVLDTNTLGSVSFDFSAPEAVNVSVNPQNAGIGDTVTVTLSTTEAIVEVPALTATGPGPEPITFDLASGDAGSVSFSWTFDVPEGLADGTWELGDIDMEDAVGNQGSKASPGSFQVDASAPQITSLSISPERVDEDDTITILFDITEAILGADMEVLIGEHQVTNCTDQGEGKSWLCTYTLDGSELDHLPASEREEALNVTVDLADAAGNTGAGSAIVILDFVDPILDCSATHDDATPLGLDGELVVTINANEVLQDIADVTSSGVTLIEDSASDTTSTWVGGGVLQGTSGALSWSAIATDEAGNTSSGGCSGTGLYDGIPPAIVEGTRSVSGDTFKAGETVTVSFQVSEAMLVPPDVRIGGLDADVVDAGASPLVYTLAVPATALDGTKIIQADLTDTAENTATDQGFPFVTFDLTAPGLVTTNVSPDPANAGDTLKIILTADERLGAVPALSVRAPDGSTVVELEPTAGSGPGELTYVYFMNVDAATQSGTWTFEDVILEDEVGNSATEDITDVFGVDNNTPVIESLAVSKSVVALGDSFTVTFTITATDLETEGVVVEVGDSGLVCTVVDTTTWSCPYTAKAGDVPAGTEASLAVLVSATDTAGNVGTDSDSVVFDYAAPTPVTSTVLYIPDPTNPLNQVSRAKSGTTIEVTVIADEDLAVSPLPALVGKHEGGGPDLVFSTAVAEVSGAAVTFGHDFSGEASSAGAYSLEVTWTDVLGNQATGVQVEGAVVEGTVGAPTLIVKQDEITYLRSPWGSSASETVAAGVKFPPGPILQLAPPEPHSSATTIDAAAFALIGTEPFESEIERVRVWAEAEKSTLLGTLNPEAGAWPRTTLSTVDTDAIYVSGIDPAGAESGAVRVRYVEWVVTPKESSFHATQPLEGSRFARASIDTPDDFEAPIEGANLLAAQGTDQTLLSIVGKGVWRDYPSSPSPQPTSGQAAAWDAARGKLVVFGGTSGGIYEDIVYEFDGDRWTKPDLPETRPSGRKHAAMTYDPVRERVLLFAGDTANTAVVTGYAKDLWEWDGATWTQVDDGSSPNIDNREGAAMAYDAARGKVVAFGGRRGDAAIVEGPDEVFHKDTLEWNGTDWTSTVHTDGPSGRAFASMAYDATRQTMLLFGGQGHENPAEGDYTLTTWNDLWSWDGTSWELVNSGGPGPRMRASMAFDEIAETTILYGGTDGTNTLTDVWEWDGLEWTDVTPSPVTGNPGTRSSASMVWSPLDERLLLYGGEEPNAGTVHNDVWAFDISGWSERVIGDVTLPAARKQAAMVWSSQVGSMLLFGGLLAGDSVDSTEGTLAFDGFDWAQLASAEGGPATRYAHGMAAPQTAGDTLLFGGTDGVTVYGDIWFFNGQAWTDRTADFAKKPGARYASPMAASLNLGEVFVFAGFGAKSTTTPLTDFWVYESLTDTWSPLGTTGGPSGRADHAMAFDDTRGKLILFGGISSEGSILDQYYNTLYEYSHEQGWSEVEIAGIWPLGRRGATMTYDPVRQQVVMTGGENATKAFGDTWAWDGFDWLQLHADSEGLDARSQHSAAHFQGDGNLLVLAGDGINGVTDSFEERVEKPDRKSAVIFRPSGESSELDPATITRLRVRAWCGGRHGNGTDAVFGSELLGWAVRGADAFGTLASGRWEQLDINDAQESETDAAELLLDWQSEDATEAQRFLMERDTEWAFACRGEIAPNAADVTPLTTMDFIELRVRLDLDAN